MKFFFVFLALEKFCNPSTRLESILTSHENLSLLGVFSYLFFLPPGCLLATGETKEPTTATIALDAGGGGGHDELSLLTLRLVSHHKRVSLFRRILSFHETRNPKDYINLRSSSKLFHRALPPPPLWTTFPCSNHATLQGSLGSSRMAARGRGEQWLRAVSSFYWGGCAQLKAELRHDDETTFNLWCRTWNDDAGWRWSED